MQKWRIFPKSFHTGHITHLIWLLPRPWAYLCTYYCLCSITYANYWKSILLLFSIFKFRLLIELLLWLFFSPWTKSFSKCHLRPHPVRPDVGVKSSPIISNICPIVSKSFPKSNNSSFYLKVRFFNNAQKAANHLGHFC